MKDLKSNKNSWKFTTISFNNETLQKKKESIAYTCVHEKSTFYFLASTFYYDNHLDTTS